MSAYLEGKGHMHMGPILLYNANNGPLTRDWTLVFGHCLIWRSNGGEGGRQGGGDERERDVQHSDRERERGR